jgi:hypothetical protein
MMTTKKPEKSSKTLSFIFSLGSIATKTSTMSMLAYAFKLESS